MVANGSLMTRLIVSLLMLALPALAENHALGVTFDAPLPLSAPVEVGVRAYSFLSPPEADLASSRLEVMVHTLPAEVAAQMRAEGVDPYANAKTVYLGISLPAPGTVKRTLLGRESVGEFYPKIRNDAVECHWAKLPDGSELLLAFRRPVGTPQAELDTLAEAVCKSLRVSAR